MKDHKGSKWWNFNKEPCKTESIVYEHMNLEIKITRSKIPLLNLPLEYSKVPTDE